MGWHINLVKNDLPLTPEMEAEINALHEGEEAEHGALLFHDDHLEHMDYVWKDEVHAILSRGEATGEVLFSSSTGDNAGEAWGYRYQEGKLTKLVRTNTGEWVPQGSVSDEELELKPTGNAPESLAEARQGDSVAVGCIYAGLTSYERSEVGDILPDGTLVVDGREFKAPDYRYSGSMGMSFVLKPVSDPSVDFEEEDEEAAG